MAVTRAIRSNFSAHDRRAGETRVRDRNAPIWPGRLLLLVAIGIAQIGGEARAASNTELDRISASIEKVERQILRESSDFDSNLTAKYVSLLRKVGRDVEAQAFHDYIERSTDGSVTDMEALFARLERCEKEKKHDRGAASLIRPLQNRWLLTVSPTAAEYRIGTAGTLMEIDVILARSPAVAWALIKSIAQTKVDRRRVLALPTTALPVSQCVFWPNGVKLNGNWISWTFETGDQGF